MGKSSQRKGADGERELAAILREHGYDIERGGSQTYGEVPDLVGLPGVHIEVKRVERLNVPEAMAQAIRDAARFGGAPAPHGWSLCSSPIGWSCTREPIQSDRAAPKRGPGVYPVRCRSRAL